MQMDEAEKQKEFSVGSPVHIESSSEEKFNFFAIQSARIDCFVCVCVCRCG